MGRLSSSTGAMDEKKGHNWLELLLFRLNGRQLYGINVFKVQEVIHCPTLTKVPQSHGVIKGIASMRGKTLSVLDLSYAIGGAASPNVQDKFIVITEHNGLNHGLLVDSVLRIVNMNWKDIQPPPKGAAGNSYMTAVAQVEGELVEIIDVEKVLMEVMGIKHDVSEGVIRPVPDGRKHHVLLADDSTVARQQVESVLDQLGVGYTACKDGQEALDLLEHWAEEGQNVKELISMVISDVEMPRMDGYSLTAAIRANPKLSGLTVLLHTSLSGDFNMSMVNKVGADDFMPKWEPDTLAMMVQDYLAHDHDQSTSVA